MKKITIKELPVLATKDIITFPNFNVNVKIGREESINAVKHSIEKYDGLIVLVLQKQLEATEITIDNLWEVGILCRVDKKNNIDFTKTPIDLGFTGYQKVELFNVKKNKFLTTEIKPIKEVFRVTEEIKKLQVELLNLVKSSIDQSKMLIDQKTLTTLLKAPLLELLDAITFFSKTPIEFKNKLLQEKTVKARIELLIKYFKTVKSTTRPFSNPKDDVANDVQKKVNEKLRDQQREFILREQLKAIKEELGELNGDGSEIDNYIKRLEKNPYPPYIKNKLLSEIKKLESTPSAAQEANITRTYIETLLDLPYWQKAEEKINITLANKILNKNHFGLEKVKERIIEYLAVKEKNPKSKGTILCLVGAPGTGKTSLVTSIAEALNRKMIKISLGGVRDEAEIRGHRRTYIAAMPGKIITAMKKAQIINPIILLDEIDKMSSDYKGDPASAMLEVLDYEQNMTFQDHFVEEDYDLSNVMFICTANYFDQIPPALYDRLEIIDISSYTELEKTEIAKQHLIPKVLQETLVNPDNFKFDDSLIKFLVRHYTMEAGVRQLYRVLEQIARKLIVLELNKKSKKISDLSEEIIIKLIGKQKFNFTKKDKKPMIGTVTGLAWTSYGGDILPIEVTSYPGKGNLVLTGSLKDVMKESASIALSYVKTNFNDFDIKFDNLDNANNFFSTNDFHIHVPEGAVPKDGPSAGVTFTTALISALSKQPVSQYYGMTGEITLRGHVLPIGGLKEKSISAYRSGLTEIFIPKENEKDIIDIPKEVRTNLKIHLIEDYKDIYTKIFNSKNVRQ